MPTSVDVDTADVGLVLDPLALHSGRDFYTHLKGTHDLLEAWGNPPDICLARLFHSVYGTWHFRRESFPIENRSIVRTLIGERAEQLVYVFCVTKRPQAFFDAAHAPDFRLFDHHAGHGIRLQRQALCWLLEIEAANLLEQGGNVGGALAALTTMPISPAAKSALSAWSSRLAHHAGDRRNSAP